MQPDMMFYAVLIEVVGAAGDLETAFKIFAKAEALIPQRQVGHIRCVLRATFPVRDCFRTLQCLHRCVRIHSFPKPSTTWANCFLPPFLASRCSNLPCHALVI